MAVIKAVHSKASIGNAINYVMQKEKTEEKLITGKDCDPFHAIDEMKATKELWHKTTGRQYDHYVQSFAEGENVSPQLAHELATKWAEEQFKGHECIIATHTDRGHTHSHIIVNTVNFEDGHKLHTSAKWLEQAKEYSDKLCREHGLSITEKGRTFEGQVREDMTTYDKDKYQLLQKAETGKVKSYVLDTAVAVMQTKAQATSRDDFIVRMAEKGYETNWQDNHKNITFTDKDGNKVRNSNIEKTFKVSLAKEELEHEFEQNRRRKVSRTAETEQSRDYPGTSYQGNVGHTVSKNEPVRSGADESGERTAQTDISRLHEQLQQIRGLDKKYNPTEQRKRDEEHKRAEQQARAERERTEREAREKAERITGKQHDVKQKHIDHSWERIR